MKKPDELVTVPTMLKNSYPDDEGRLEVKLTLTVAPTTADVEDKKVDEKVV